MMAELLDGKALAERIRADLRENIQALSDAGARPGLATIHMGDDPAAETYIQMKQNDCEELGINGKHVDVDSDAPESRLHEVIEELNDDDSVHGILVQQDSPDHVDWENAIERLDPMKDVDGLHPENIGLLVAGRPRFVSCTPLGIQTLLLDADVEITGSDVVVVNRSPIVGKPLANLLMQDDDDANATVTVCHSRTKDLATKTRNADILVAAVDQPNFIDESMVGEDATVIDVGINRIDADTEKGYEIVGDVDHDSVEPKVSHITPVPGGVGPMTRVMLHYNTVQAAQIQTGVTLD
jgi:methylenetetrahydrofolate dehydrogenase (NADP+)/methenyltetrahydrofolate cyclohydrolase